MTQQAWPAFTPTQRQAWDELIKRAVRQSISGLTSMVGVEVGVSSIRQRRVEVTSIPDELGGAGTECVGILLGVEHIPAFHMALVHRPETAFALVDMLLGEQPGTTETLDEMATSTLGEMGNIMCSFFLNTVADETGHALRPTPPMVRADMTGAILDYALAELLMETDEIALLETTYGTSDLQIDGIFAVMPTAGIQAEILKTWRIA